MTSEEAKAAGYRYVGPVSFDRVIALMYEGSYRDADRVLAACEATIDEREGYDKPVGTFGQLRELLIGCGNSRRKKLANGPLEWSDLVTIDHDPNCGADIVHDLDIVPWPAMDSEFDEAHAYQVLEHLGQQGDVHSFFATFAEIWRILKPGGMLFATVPSYKSIWAWGDPSHKRIINPGTIQFLSQFEYHRQVGRTSMSDFRHIWHGDFEIEHADDDGDDCTFVLQAMKPARSFD